MAGLPGVQPTGISFKSLRGCQVQQMTGLADPVYVEAFLQAGGFAAGPG